MVTIEISEAEALDRLAILEVKLLNKLPVTREYAELFNLLARQPTLKRAIRTKYYRELVDCNRRVFNLVEKAKHDRCRASTVDRANHRRYLAKRRLQEKLWPEAPHVEAKTRRPYAT